MSGDTPKFKKPYYEKEAATRESAMPEFVAHDLFGTLIPASVDSLLLEQLGHRTAAAWSAGNLQLWRKRVITAFGLLQKVPGPDVQKLAEIVELTLHAYYGPQKSAYFTAEERRRKAEASEAEERFPALFQEYQHTFENLYRHVATMFAFAKEAVFGLTQTVKSAQWWLEQSAKTKAGKLDSPLTLGQLPLGTLTQGYDRHFRNAIAHVRYKFVDQDTVVMWDTNEKGRETWRKTLSYKACEQKQRILWETISVMEAAYFLYEMNSGHLAAEAIDAAHPQRGTEERHNLVYILAKKRYNLDVIDLQDDGASLSIFAKIVPNFTIPQTSKVYIGGDSWAKSYDVEQTVQAVPLNRVAFGYIRALRKNLGELTRLTLEIQDENGADAGRIVLAHDQIEFLNTVDDSKVPVETLATEENSLRPLEVKFTQRGAPHPSRPEPSLLMVPPPKRIIVPK